MLLRLGADLVGMSTVLILIAAQHRGAHVLAMSLATHSVVFDLNRREDDATLIDVKSTIKTS